MNAATAAMSARVEELERQLADANETIRVARREWLGTEAAWLAGVSFPRGRAVVESHCTSMRIALDLVDPEGPSDEH
jgi:hypothetical protein